MPDTCDVAIVGGAAMGSSLAYHLVADPGFSGRVLVIEKDPTYRRSASALSAASIRQQFSSPVNIRISLFGIRFLRGVGERLAVDGERPDIALREADYLYLASEGGARVLEENHALQTREGADIELFTQQALLNRFPWAQRRRPRLRRLGPLGRGLVRRLGVAAGLPQEGARPRGGVPRRTRRRARARGQPRDRRATGGRRAHCMRRGRELRRRGRAGARRDGRPGHPGLRQAPFGVRLHLPRAPRRIPAPHRRHGRVVPSRRRGLHRRGVARSRGGSGLGGRRSGDPGARLGLFEERVWPALAHRVPAFEAIRPGRAWAGPYDMNLLDHNAILGPAGEPANFHLCNGFSGHGLQQSPAVGRGLAELIVQGRYITLDLSDLGFERVRANRPLRERNVI